ncbi:MAG: radical SAM protein [bacterium]
MLDVSSLYCGSNQDGDSLRYGKSGDTDTPNSGQDRKPVVVFNITRDCNLRCVHCYSGSDRKHYPGQLETSTILSTLEDLAEFDVPAVLLSGGEPLVHRDFDPILKKTEELGLRTTISTNGTLIDEERAVKLKESSLRYVGVSLDGIGDLNDDFRGLEGAFERALDGIRNCKKVNQKVGLRMTLTSYNVGQLDEVFDLLEEENIDRVCFYHLAYAGRGKEISNADLTDEERRSAVETILERTRQAHKQGNRLEVLTVANPVDNAYLYKKLLQDRPRRADQVKDLLEWNGGGLNSSGVGIASIDFYGRVHPNQFWMSRTLGNIKNRPFSDIWTDESDGFLENLRNRKPLLDEPCQSCEFLDLCGGGLRLRAEASGNLWGRDPSCYLSQKERNDESYLEPDPSHLTG